MGRSGSAPDSWHLGALVLITTIELSPVRWAQFCPAKTRILRDGLTCAAGRPSPFGPSAWPGPSRLSLCAEIRRRALVLLLALLVGRPDVARA